MWRLGSPSCGSILITCAPPSASACPAHGTAMKWPNSSTVTPANGWLISLRGAPRSLAYALAPGLSPAAADTSTRGHTESGPSGAALRNHVERYDTHSVGCSEPLDRHGEVSPATRANVADDPAGGFLTVNSSAVNNSTRTRTTDSQTDLSLLK